MNLGELILALKPLLEEPSANSAAIIDLLERHKSLAEFEVARFYVSSAFAPVVERQVKEVDPHKRALATRGIATVLARSDAARILRRLVKDPHPLVRSAARASVRRLGLDDVALPDTRFEVPRYPRPLAPGLWNPSGWSFGLYRRGGGVQLRRKGKGTAPRPTLPNISGVDALAKLLGLGSEKELVALQRAGEGNGSPYVAFTIDKARGGTRTIHAPKKKLKAVQRKILSEILAHIPTHAACHGFTKGRSIVTNAKPHVRARVVVKVDLADFFPSIHFRRVAGLFEEYGLRPDVSHALASLTTHRSVVDGETLWPGVLPQGAPTSPAIANIVCRRLDTRLTALAKKVGATYTRYADDLTFSFATEPKANLGRFLWWVDQICQAEGFAENPIKRRIHRRGRAQLVTGIVVNEKLSVPRERRRKFRALLHRVKTRGLAAMVKEQPSLRAELEGFAAYVNMVQPDLGKRLAAEVEALVKATP